MEVARLEPERMSGTELAQVHRVGEGCHAEENRLEPFWPAADLGAFLRHPPSSEPRHYWTARLNRDLVGFAQLSLPPDSPLGFASVLVHPDARRRGTGTALVAAVLEDATASGRTALLGRYSTPTGAAFAARPP